jgi:glycosyltransferase involved in cell wall biosynthesis
MTLNPELTLLVPAIPGRYKRLKAILERVSMSIGLYNEKYEEKLKPQDVEFVIVDGGSDDYQDLCAQYMSRCVVKYVYVPLKRFVCAAYPRNVGLRLCQGKVILHLDIDHFPSQNIVEGALRPFVDGAIDRYINRGFVIDTSKSPHGKGPNVPWLNEFNERVLSPNWMYKPIEDVYRAGEVPPPGRNNTLWIWAAKREYLDMLNGYDEIFCRQFSYSREDDSWRQRMLANGMPLYDGAHKLFCAIHLWHTAAQRTLASNALNRAHYNLTCGQGIMDVSYAKQFTVLYRNKDWEWGKLVAGSFSIIDGIKLEPSEHESWINWNTEKQAYRDNPTWESVDHFMAALEEYAKDWWKKRD